MPATHIILLEVDPDGATWMSFQRNSLLFIVSNTELGNLSVAGQVDFIYKCS